MQFSRLSLAACALIVSLAFAAPVANPGQDTTNYWANDVSQSPWAGDAGASPAPKGWSQKDWNNKWGLTGNAAVDQGPDGCLGGQAESFQFCPGAPPPATT